MRGILQLQDQAQPGAALSLSSERVHKGETPAHRDGQLGELQETLEPLSVSKWAPRELKRGFFGQGVEGKDKGELQCGGSLFSGSSKRTDWSLSLPPAAEMGRTEAGARSSEFPGSTKESFPRAASSAGHSWECCLQGFANRALALSIQSDVGAAPGSPSTTWKSHVLGHTQVSSNMNVLLWANTTSGVDL